MTAESILSSYEKKSTDTTVASAPIVQPPISPPKGTSMSLNLAKVGAPEGRRTNHKNLFTDEELNSMVAAADQGYSNKQIFDAFEANNGRAENASKLGVYITAHRKRMAKKASA